MNEHALTETQLVYYKRSSIHLSIVLNYLIMKLMKINPFLDMFSQRGKKHNLHVKFTEITWNMQNQLSYLELRY